MRALIVFCCWIVGCASAPSWQERADSAREKLAGDFDGELYWHELMVAHQAARDVAELAPDPEARCRAAGAIKATCEARVLRERAPESVVGPLRERLYEVLDQLARRAAALWKEAVEEKRPATAAAHAVLWRLLRNERPLSLVEALGSEDLLTRYLATFTVSTVPILWVEEGGKTRVDLGPLATHARIEPGEPMALRRELATRGVRVVEVEVGRSLSRERVEVVSRTEVVAGPKEPSLEELKERHAAVLRSGQRCTGGPTEWSTEDTRWVTELDKNSPYYGRDRLTTTRRTYTFESPRTCTMTPEAQAELARLEEAMQRARSGAGGSRVVVKTHEVKVKTTVVPIDIRYGGGTATLEAPPGQAMERVRRWLEVRVALGPSSRYERGWDRFAMGFSERPNDDLHAFVARGFPLVLPPTGTP